MAISYPLSLPATKSPSRIVLSASVVVSTSQSPFTLSTQVQEFSGQKWFAEISLPYMTREDAEQYTTFLLKLNGKKGTFLLGDSASPTPRGSAAGDPVVDGAGQTGQTLLTTGWDNSETGVLLAGDYIQIGQRLYKVLSDANSNGSGDAELDIWPRLRESPGDGAAIVTANCVGLFRLQSNDYDLFSVGPDRLYALSFSAEEAI